MGDTDRGYLLELMVTKLLYAKADEGWQIVGMSATIPNTIDLQRWLSTPTRTHSVYTSCCVADVSTSPGAHRCSHVCHPFPACPAPRVHQDRE